MNEITKNDGCSITVKIYDRNFAYIVYRNWYLRVRFFPPLLLQRLGIRTLRLFFFVSDRNANKL